MRVYIAAEPTDLRKSFDGLPEIQDAHTVDCVGGALWVVGSKDSVRLEGSRWERIDHVDNAPIR